MPLHRKEFADGTGGKSRCLYCPCAEGGQIRERPVLGSPRKRGGSRSCQQANRRFLRGDRRARHYSVQPSFNPHSGLSRGCRGGSSLGGESNRSAWLLQLGSIHVWLVLDGRRHG